MIWLRDDFAKAWTGRDPFEEAAKLQGELFRDMPGRRTLRFEQDGASFFLKLHYGVGWGEIFKNLVRGRLPILGASNEYEAIRRCEKLGVATMTPVAFGKKGANPAKQTSFIVTEDLTGTISLEDLALDWATTPPDYRLKTALIRKVGKISGLLHRNGLNHRDYYICHFLLKIPNGVEGIDPDDLQLHLIDLHRAQLRQQVPKRWLFKDVVGLYFSTFDMGFSQRDYLRFIRSYTGLPLKQALSEYRWLWDTLQAKAEKLYVRKAKRDL